MKKLVAAITLLVYFTVTTGFTVSVHYCMNKQVSVELGYSAKDDCGKCGMSIKKNTGCCKDDVHVVKMQADHSTTNTVVHDFSLAPLTTSFQDPYNFFFLQSTTANYPLAHGPPLNGQKIYLANCVFRL